jgi:shikimate kinase
MAIKQGPPSIDRVFLVGFMGAGKTTVGRLLAIRLGWSFVDLDDRIRAREGREIAQIFRESGEAYFREVESACLRELIEKNETQGSSTRRRNRGDASLGMTRFEGGVSLGKTAEEGVVVALGGGAFVQPDNARLLREYNYPSIFLDASVEELRRRCVGEGAERPLLRDENQFRQLYEARRGGYMTADFRVDTGGKTPEQVVEELSALAFFGSGEGR